jgi:hypothetical protein
MTKNYPGPCLTGIVIIGILLTPAAYADDMGVLILDLTPDVTAETVDDAPEFQPMHVKVVKIIDNTEVTFCEFNITEQKDINIPVPTGTYKLYVQLHGHRTVWELDNEGRGYEISPSSSTVVPAWVNTFCKDVFADAPWRVQSSKIPILVMVKDADGMCGDYDLGNVEIYLDEDCDEDDDEADDTLLETETKWHGVTVDDSFYNLYYPGDWYGITYLNPSEHGLSGDVCFHVVIRDIGGWVDPDGDTHSHFNVTIISDTLPILTNWHAGDTHYHSSYTDNIVEFGFPVEATVEAGKAIGLDWNAITDHSFDLGESKTADLNHKWNALKSDVSSYTTGSYRLILGEEVSCYGHENSPDPQVPRGVVHFLVFGMENFNNVGGTGLDFVPGGHDEPLCDDPTWNLEDVIEVVNSQGGVSYAAHPEGHRGATAEALDRVPWITEDYDLTGYNGLQLWNMYNNDYERDLGLEQWKRLLLNGRKDVFVAGGSDAHGDFSHATTVFGDSVNAFGKVRTYIYTENLNTDGILNALRNGHSIMTDGPLVIFDINGEMIGNNVSLTNRTNATLRIQWNSTQEFGYINNIIVKKGVINGTEETNFTIIQPSSIGKNSLCDELELIISPNESCYYRVEAYSNTTNGEQYRCYTNPIWIDVLANDTSPPVVTITAPVNGSIVSTPNVTVTGFATDDIGIVTMCYGHVCKGKGGGGGCAPLANSSINVSINWTVYHLCKGWNIISVTAVDAGGNAGNASVKVIYKEENITTFDTSPGTYPSIFGTHNGTITPNQTITVSKLYTYPCEGTGGHTNYARIWNSSCLDVNATWKGYAGDWHNISFSEPFTLVANETYNYTIKTGSYPQIHHTSTLPTANGWINCTKFTDANGKRYKDWIPAIRLE